MSKYNSDENLDILETNDFNFQEYVDTLPELDKFPYINYKEINNCNLN